MYTLRAISSSKSSLYAVCIAYNATIRIENICFVLRK